MKTILVIEDDENLSETLQLYVQRERWRCLVSHSAEAGFSQIESSHPDLVVLDVMLPDANGFEICQQLRQKECFVPILMLTARGEERDRIRGLSAGADDYLMKPFSAKELIARLSALLRRSYTAGYRDIGHRSGLTIEGDRRMAFLNGELLDLRGKEFDLLSQLAAVPGRAYSREELLERIWGIDYEGDTRIVDVYVRKLRAKVEVDASRPDYIQTVWGVGYRFNALET
ncbi:response regulator transcription factor [Oscillatoria sp. CS-180]|uniref:response regulator transcription factor n=1 Tax=Oscillatoria sp. CS-180 TaxID=3021720 RepID=UPI00232C6056|nr:response regulator transcription factor [Oscillatoria sp. CS-180]MDB9527140.1 response regulator transcription factor [Oscillatoria sp. CS-180]